MAAATRQRQRSAIEDVGGEVGRRIEDIGGHVGRTLETSVTGPPGWQELAWDTVLVGGDSGGGGEPAGCDPGGGAEQADSRGAMKVAVRPTWTASFRGGPL